MSDPRSYNPQWQPQPVPHQPPPPPQPPKKHTARNIFIVLAAVVIALLALAAILPDPSPTGSTNSPGTTNTYDPGIQTPPTQAAPTKTAEKPKLSVSRENALRSAETYLDTGNFSRKSLITQLKFEGFPTADATYAVDHVEVNWNTEAAEAATVYLNTGSFSHDSLTQQLIFEGFTAEQAAFGVKSVGL